MSLHNDFGAALPPQLPQFLMNQRWFGGKAREIRSAELVDFVPLASNELEAFVLLVQVAYTGSSPETYILPMVSAENSTVAPAGGASSLVIPGQEGNKQLALTDALKNQVFLLQLLEAIETQPVWQGLVGQIHAARTDAFQDIRSRSAGVPQPSLMKGEQSNTSLKYGNCFILKLFRRLNQGINPDLEIGLFLTEKARFPNAPRVAGSFSYHAGSGEPTTLGILQEFIPNRGDAWQLTMDALSGFWERVSAYSTGSPAELSTASSGDHRAPAAAAALIGPYLDAIGLLGKRTAELHEALASDLADSAFIPEPYTDSFQLDYENSARELTRRNFGLLRAKLRELPEPMRERAGALLQREPEILERLRFTAGPPSRGMRTRIHGDYHLGQVLYTGSDFVVIDFEGEPQRPISERRIKRSPLHDVAGMLRSFHYAAFAQLLAPVDGAARPKSFEALAPWADRWYTWVSARFLNTYLQTARPGGFLPPGDREVAAILKLHLLEKAVYELGYELNNRPTWVAIPLAGISKLLTE